MAECSSCKARLSAFEKYQKKQEEAGLALFAGAMLVIAGSALLLSSLR